MDPIEELRRVVVQGFAAVNERFDALDAKLSGRIDGLDAKMEARFARVDEDLAFVRRAILDHSPQLKDIRRTLDKKVDRDEVEAMVERAVARATGH